MGEVSGVDNPGRRAGGPAVAAGGGTVMAAMLDEAAITTALLRLAEPDGTSDRLRQQAAARPVRTGRDVACDLAMALARAPASGPLGPVGG